MYFWNFQTFIWATRVQAGGSGGNDNWHAILRKNHKKVKSHKGWVMYWKETFYEFDQVDLKFAPRWWFYGRIMVYNHHIELW